MLTDFQLAALVHVNAHWRLLQIPLHQDLQGSLSTSWSEQYEAFTVDVKEIAFDAGYTPEPHECFQLEDYALPAWLQASVGGEVRNLESINEHEELVGAIKAVIGFARNAQGSELMLAQSFTHSHVIQPGRYLFLESGTYQSPVRPGLSLGTRLAAVYDVSTQKLLFENFRTTNAFLPLTDVIADASDHDIRDVLTHALLQPEDVDATLACANQWFRKRFALLKASNILGQFTTAQLVERSKGYEVELKVEKGRIVFPADKVAAKRVLQFLNEEIFRGAITEKLYETNSKRESDG